MYKVGVVEDMCYAINFSFSRVPFSVCALAPSSPLSSPLSSSLLPASPLGRTESGGIVLAAHAGPRVPSGGVNLKRRCTHRSSVVYLIVNKLISLPPSPLISLFPLLTHLLHLPPSLPRCLSPALSLSVFLARTRARALSMGRSRI